MQIHALECERSVADPSVMVLAGALKQKFGHIYNWSRRECEAIAARLLDQGKLRDQVGYRLMEDRALNDKQAWEITKVLRQALSSKEANDA